MLPRERLTRLELGPLTSSEALELTQALAPALGDDDARNLAALASRSPFWIEALVRTGGVAAEGAAADGTAEAAAGAPDATAAAVSTGGGGDTTGAAAGAWGGASGCCPS